MVEFRSRLLVDVVVGAVDGDLEMFALMELKLFASAALWPRQIQRPTTLSTLTHFTRQIVNGYERFQCIGDSEYIQASYPPKFVSSSRYDIDFQPVTCTLEQGF